MPSKFVWGDATYRLTQSHRYTPGMILIWSDKTIRYNAIRTCLFQPASTHAESTIDQANKDIHASRKRQGVCFSVCFFFLFLHTLPSTGWSSPDLGNQNHPNAVITQSVPITQCLCVTSAMVNAFASLRFMYR